MTWQVRALIGLVLTCFALFSAAVLSNSAAYKLYQADLQDNRGDCEAERKAEQGKHSKECQSLLYRALDDPVALLTGALFIATVGLFVVTYGLFSAAMRQGRDAERLFVKDQRPWVQINVESGREILQAGEVYRIKFALRGRNIGKSPAYQVTSSFLFPHIGYDGLAEYFVETRTRVEHVMQVLGRTLLPNEEFVWEHSLDIISKNIEDSRRAPMIGTFFLAVCFKYRSELTGQVHETSRVYIVDILGGMALFIVSPPLDRFNDKITLNGLPLYDITT